MDEVIIPVCNQVSDYVLGQGFWVRRQHMLVLAVCAFMGVLSIAIRLLTYRTFSSWTNALHAHVVQKSCYVRLSHF